MATDADPIVGNWYEHFEALEEWTGAINNIERDDLGYTETEMTGEWSHLRRQVRPRRVIEKEAEEEDEWCEGYPEEEPWEERVAMEPTPIGEGVSYDSRLAAETD